MWHKIRQAGLWKAISIKDVAGPTPANLLPFAEKAKEKKVARKVVPQNESVLRLESLGISQVWTSLPAVSCSGTFSPWTTQRHHHLCPQAKCNCAGCDGCNFSEHAGRDPWETSTVCCH